MLRRTARLLIVDDEPDILESLSAVLAQEIDRTQIRIATSGPQALGLLQEEPADVILTDYRMPDMNGLEFLRRARAIAPRAAIIMMTAYPTAQIAVDAAGAGVALLVAKPFEIASFVDVIRAVLRREIPEVVH